MKKIRIIAWREYKAMVGTKAFIISIVMMPVLMFAGLIGMELFDRVGQARHREIAVIDHSDQIFSALSAEAEARNEQLEQARQEKDDRPRFPGMTEDLYQLQLIDNPTIDDDLRFSLSEKVRQQKLYAFVEIPASVLELEPSDGEAMVFYAEDSSISPAKSWLQRAVTKIARDIRLKKSGIDPEQLERFRKFNRSASVVGQGLMKQGVAGEIESSGEKNLIMTLFMPMGVMMLMFMVIFMASQPMLESVLEEKSQRIAEVLLGSANPFQLMMGKLIGTVAGSLTIFTIYLAGAYLLSISRDWSENVPFEIVPWFVIFQITGVLFYASIFMAIGASVSQLKEAQSLLLPVWMLLMAPLFVWIMIVRDPQGPIALGMSFFPPTAPTTMVLRMATGQTIPFWQPLTSLVVTVLATFLIVLLAARIFRVGILWQGKTPRLTEIFRWAVLGD